MSAWTDHGGERGSPSSSIVVVGEAHDDDLEENRIFERARQIHFALRQARERWANIVMEGLPVLSASAQLSHQLVLLMVPATLIYLIATVGTHQ